MTPQGFRGQEPEFKIHDKVIITNPKDIMHGCVGKVVGHGTLFEDNSEVLAFKIKFDFKTGQYKPRPKDMALTASNIQYRLFAVSALTIDTKLNRLLYG